MFKFFGALCVLSACGAFSFFHVLRAREGRRACTELSNVCTELARAISFRLEPLPDIICRLEQDEKAPAKLFLSQLVQGFSAENAPDFSALWSDALQHFSAETNLPKEGLSIVSTLGTGLGQADFETESARLHRAAEDLQNLAQKLHSESATAEKTTKALGLLLGAFIVIVLL